MRRIKQRIKCAVGAGVLGVLVGLVAVAPGQEARAEADGVREENGNGLNHVYLSVGRATILKAPWQIKRVSVAEPGIADVQVVAPNQVVVVARAKAVGSTDLHLWNEAGEVWHALLHIKQDLSQMKDHLSKFFPESDLDVTNSNGVMVVSGQLRRSEDVERLREFLKSSGLKHVDLTRVTGVQQVQLRVRVAEASREAIRSLGVNAVHGGKNFFGGSVVGGNPNGIDIGVASGSSATSLPFTFNSATSVASTVTLFGGFPRADLEVFLDALTENRYMRTLAEPTLVALSGEEAMFLAGGEFPIPVAQSGTGDKATISIEFKEFGIGLKFRPTVLGDGTIRLRVAPEVSDVSFVNGITSGGVTVPSIITRRAQTTLEMNSGQTFAMAGLLDRSVNATASGVPGLTQVPILGSLFRSVRYQTGETELIVLVTATLVEPLSGTSGRPLPGDAHQSPTDWELYSNGQIEGKSSPALSGAQERWLKKRGLDRLAGPGAWAKYGQAPGSRKGESPAPVEK